jgi:hypothetical protein
VAEDNSSTQIEYRPIEGFPGYRVGSDGSVWTEWEQTAKSLFTCTGRWRPLKSSSSRGYPTVYLSKKGQRVKTRKVHHLVLESFIGPRPSGCEACHQDGNRFNNHAENLRWDSRKANHADKKAHGTSQIGERNPFAKLTLQ